MNRSLAAVAAFTLLMAAVSTAPAAAQTPPTHQCYPTSGGLDYQSYVCYDLKDPFCPVYTLTHSDWGTTKKCIGP